ncbi:MAG: sulfur carrier protein ThiS [Kiritimatiellales bacterium]|nr:sulfur carrier protein ThiS [Kiritimatiellales bacterium]
MELTVNGKQHEHHGNGSVAALLTEIGAVNDRTALMVNGKVVPSNIWENTLLRANDEVEVLVFVGGG